MARSGPSWAIQAGDTEGPTHIPLWVGGDSLTTPGHTSVSVRLAEPTQSSSEFAQMNGINNKLLYTTSSTGIVTTTVTVLQYSIRRWNDMVIAWKRPYTMWYNS
jgi:hypothetical protein